MASKLSKFKRRRNAGDVKDLAISAGAAFAGYGAARFTGRFAFKMAVQKNPKLARHAPVIGAALATVGTYYGTQWWDKARPYSEAAAIGAGVALIQAGVQSYVPHLAFLVSDPKASEYLQAPVQNKALPAAPPGPVSDSDFNAMLEADGLEATDFQLPSGDEDNGSISDAELDEILLQ